MKIYFRHLRLFHAEWFFLCEYLGRNISTDESINPPPPSQTWTRKRHFSDAFNDLVNRILRVLLFWASWLWLVGELQQKKVFPRLTEAAVADSQQNLNLIKNAARLSLADSRAGLVSFELACRSLAVTWEVQLNGYYHTN